MPGLAMNSVEAVTILVLCACVAGFVAVGRRAYGSAVERNGAKALEAALGAVMLLVVSVAFFNNQAPRRIRGAAPPWIAKSESGEPASREVLQRQAEVQAALRRERQRQEEDERRARERNEREQLFEQVVSDRKR